MALTVCCRLTGRAALVLSRRHGASVAAASRNTTGAHLRWRSVSGVRTCPGPGRAPRRFCSAARPSAAVTYEELKRALVGGSAVVIDVREPWELREYGTIPGSINVPLAQVSTALQLKPEEFKEKYGGDMPLATENIVFTCLAGLRSVKALEDAVSLGYHNAQHYPGGWQDWAKHEILQTKEWHPHRGRK
ncbi:thiosulfate sulfurtransferase/rhodanese-like domain-containing protein 3 [Brachyhypopomus gauderio]|uniref:thiosulfate sulfurtransferase/rhodanese-like domain-containing protein 3 n=1 Tax=Brachyhypopomus gauderio TaxID=698409 RepID=UPI0040423CC7